MHGEGEGIQTLHPTEFICYKITRDAETVYPMLATYEEEQANLRARLEEVRSAIAVEHETTDGAEHFIRLVKQYSEITELTSEIVAAFIERVEVHKAVKVDGVKQQTITVYYNFIGNIDT